MADKPRPQDGEPEELPAEDALKRTRPASGGPVRPVGAGGPVRPVGAGGPMRPVGAGGPVRPTVAPLPRFIAEHTLAADETLSHLALKYYGHATPPYWKLIYEANKELIGDNPNRVRPGMVIKIPELPDGMK